MSTLHKLLQVDVKLSCDNVIVMRDILVHPAELGVDVVVDVVVVDVL
jgi:hypothetical protein